MSVLKLTRIVAMVVLAASAAAPSAAQDAPRGYAEGIAGAARGVETDSAYAGLGAWRVRGRWEVFGEVGRLRNAIGDDLHARLQDAEAAILAATTLQFGTNFPVVFDARVPAWYGFGGVRAGLGTARRVSPYVEGGAGTARLDPQVHLTINGDRIDSEAAALIGLPGGDLAFVAGGGAGVAVQVWKRVRVEGGYRYMRLFGDARVDINRVHAGAGWTF